MRIDVQLPPDTLQAELLRLHARLQSHGDPLHDLATLPIALAGLRFRHRLADGEHYVYVEDPVRQRLAGCTVFNRLIEVTRRADPHVRGPHSRYAPDYQRRGIAAAVYRWALATGQCLVSGPRQSAGAHALWMSLAREHPLGYVDLRDKVLRWLGPDVAPDVLADFHTRMVLLGRGWDWRTFLARTGCLPATAPAAAIDVALDEPWALRHWPRRDGSVA